MISIVIPTLDVEQGLSRTLAALVPAAVDGLVREVLVVDGGSHDRTLEIADAAGVDILKTAPGRGAQLDAGARRARFPWLLFVNADTELAAGWEREAAHFMACVDGRRIPPSAAAFRFALDDAGLAPRLLELLARFRTGVLGFPYADQGLLIPRRLYDEIGGFAALPVMEDVDLARRLGRRRLTSLRSKAVSGTARYRRDGYLRSAMRSQLRLALYLCRVPVERIAGVDAAGEARP